MIYDHMYQLFDLLYIRSPPGRYERFSTTWLERSCAKLQRDILSPTQCPKCSGTGLVRCVQHGSNITFGENFRSCETIRRLYIPYCDRHELNIVNDSGTCRMCDSIRGMAKCPEHTWKIQAAGKKCGDCDTIRTSATTCTDCKGFLYIDVQRPFCDLVSQYKALPDRQLLTTFLHSVNLCESQNGTYTNWYSTVTTTLTTLCAHIENHILPLVIRYDDDSDCLPCILGKGVKAVIDKSFESCPTCDDTIDIELSGAFKHEFGNSTHISVSDDRSPEMNTLISDLWNRGYITITGGDDFSYLDVTGYGIRKLAIKV